MRPFMCAFPIYEPLPEGQSGHVHPEPESETEKLLESRSHY